MSHRRDDPIRLGVAQGPSAFFDVGEGVERAVDWIEKAGKKKVDVLAFGETWLQGYPFFIDAPLSELWWEAAGEYHKNAVTLDSPEVQAICAAAAKAGCDVVIGLVEAEPATRGTVYATLAFISREGEVLGRHRKIKPTHHERSIWGEGDAKGLIAHERPYGRLSGLNCWEHNVVLPGYALIAQGTSVHVAAWPGREPKTAPAEPVWARQHLLSRAFASQAGAYVLCAAGRRLHDDVPERWRDLSPFEHDGGSAIVDPRGEIIAEAGSKETLLIADADPALIRQCKAACDAAGHYMRPDLFEVRVAGKRVFPPETAGNL